MEIKKIKYNKIIEMISNDHLNLEFFINMEIDKPYKVVSFNRSFAEHFCFIYSAYDYGNIYDIIKNDIYILTIFTIIKLIKKLNLKLFHIYTYKKK